MNQNEPAFPQMHTIIDRSEDVPSVHRRINGLTKRELIAAMAMQGELSSQFTNEYASMCYNKSSAKDLAELSVVYADALLAELSKTDLPKDSHE